MRSNMRLKHTLIILSLGLLTTACSQKLTRDKAAEMLRSNDQIVLRRRDSIPITIGGVDGELSQTERVLIQEGLVTVSGTARKPGQQTNAVGQTAVAASSQPIPTTGILQTTPKGDKILWRNHGHNVFNAMEDLYGLPRSQSWEVPISRAKFLEITGIKEEGEGKATVEFTYEWQLDELGQKIAKADPGNELVKSADKAGGSSSATFEKYDDGWRITSMPPIQ